MPSNPITLLHISDPQFGKNHRFAQQDLSDWDAPFDTLLSRLQEDLKGLQKDPGLIPDLLVVTGDLAEWGLKSEFEDALRFIRSLRDFLKLPPSRVAVIPGNHDINRALCESYFLDCKGEEREPAFPYWPKWKHYVWFFQELYRDTPGAEFTEDLPWSFFEMPDLKVVVAGLNSTMQESHRDDDHYGWVGETQLRWFRETLTSYQEQGWLRVGAVHHNFRRGAMRDDENLRDADDLQRVLSSSINLLLHGHTHEGKFDWIHPGLPILSTGSTALNPEQRPPEVPNQYQIIRISPNRIFRWTRGFASDRSRWIGDTRASEDGSRWWDEQTVAFTGVQNTFPDYTAEETTQPAPDRDLQLFREYTLHHDKRDDFLSRVEAVCRLREPESNVERIPGTGAWGDYLRCSRRAGGIATLFPVAAIEKSLSPELFQLFLSEVDARYRRTDPQLISILVYGGEPVSKELSQLAETKRVHLQSFLEYQGLIDFRSYVMRQTEKLTQDTVYPPKLYVSQRMRFQRGLDEMSSVDALYQVQEWLSSPIGRFVVLLGDFGTGKTFLLHELARRMGEEAGGLIPILLQMRSLEKGRDLNGLLAQHFAQEGVEDFSPNRFRYMLEQGRISLLFDGFDELALRVTYERAAEHFDTLLQAGAGAAKVVVTSRRTHFLSDLQVKTALLEKVESVPGYRIAVLQPFDKDQIRAFLVNYCGNEEQAERRLSLIDRVKDLLGLSHNPRLLGFIVDIEEQQLEKAADREGQITAARLYELLLERWLIDEFKRVHPKGAPPGLSVQDRWQGVTSLALRLWQKTDSSAGLAELAEDAARVIAALNQVSMDPAIAAFQLGSGTFLVRDEDGNFSFLHQSILEWLVARHAAGELKRGTDPESLTIREFSPLMADFLSSLATGETSVDWAQRTLAGNSTEAAKKNALLILERQGETAKTSVHLAGQDLRGRDFSYQDLTGADLTGSDLTGARLIETILETAHLVDTKLVGADLSSAFLSGANLSGANLTGARLMGANLQGAHLRGTVLRRAKLLASDLGSGTLKDCDVFGAAFVPSLTSLLGAAGFPEAFAWSRDGEFIASAEGSHIKLWEVSTGREIRRFQGHESGILSVTFSPDGKALASASYDRTARLWEVATGRESRCFQGHEIGILSVTFSPDGQVLASASYAATILLWEVATGREIRRFQGNDSVRSVTFSPNGQVLASGSDDKTVRLWEVATGREIKRFQGHEAWIRSVAFSPDGQVLASASDDNTIRLWEVATGREIRNIREHQGLVRSIDFSPDGYVLASGSDDKTIRLWEVTTGREINRFQGGQHAIVAFSPDGQVLASASYDKTVRLWEVATGREIRRLQGHRTPIRSVAFSPNGQALASASDDYTRFWEIATGCEIRRLQGHQSWIRSIAFSPDGRALASCSDDHTVRLWEVATGREIRGFQGHENWVWSVAFSPDGETLASASDDNTVRLWEVTTGREIRRLQGYASIRSIAFSPDGQALASGSDDNSVRLWEVGSGSEIRHFQAHQKPVRSVAFSPDGQALASGSNDTTARLWEVATGREIRHLQGHKDWIRSVTFSPDGQILASGSDDYTIRLWEVATGREIRRLQGHESWILSVAFDVNGQYLASGAEDNTVRLWDVGTGTCLAILGHLPEGWVAFSPDGRYKLGGISSGGFWHVINLCRFEAGELDDWIPGLRLPDDASFFDLPPWKPEVRKPESLRRAKA